MVPVLENKKSNVFILYILGFLLTLHAALPTYINSSFISRVTTEKYVGLVYALSSIASIYLFFIIPKILKRFGNYRTAVTLIVINFVSLLGLIWSKNSYLAVICFIGNFLTVSLIGFNLDVFLEKYSKDGTTGKIRGGLLSTSNIAWIVAPLVGSFILTDGDYWKIFLATALILWPIYFLMKGHLKNFSDPEYKTISLRNAHQEIFADKNIRGVFTVSFLLQFFYSWMIIYTPIYLYSYIGFKWSEIGVIFSIMLLPFVLTEAPLGKLADKRWGEKEVMSVGFIVMAIATGLMSFVDEKSALLWTIMLFASRVGAAMVEIMSETYFFKKVDATKTNVIGLFRTMRPFAYLASSIVATLLFGLSLPIKYIFIVLAIIMFVGLHWSLELKDTK